jgi:hypothetical protein
MCDKWITRCVYALMLTLSATGSTWADILTATTINLGGGEWRYNLTLDDPYSFPLSGLNILQANTLFGLDLGSTISTPAGWDFFAPLPPLVDELNFFSLSSASDAKPGIPLVGFSFDSATDPSTLTGPIQFDVINGITGTQVPEPSGRVPLGLLVLGAAALMKRRVKKPPEINKTSSLC